MLQGAKTKMHALKVFMFAKSKNSKTLKEHYNLVCLYDSTNQATTLREGNKINHHYFGYRTKENNQTNQLKQHLYLTFGLTNTKSLFFIYVNNNFQSE
jgi:hypothetical protein